jgi:hypothetical protein
MNLSQRVLENIAFMQNLMLVNGARFESGRVARASELAQSEIGFKSAVEKYHTTIFFCGCMDSMCRGVTCKHKLAVMLVSGLFA